MQSNAGAIRSILLHLLHFPSLCPHRLRWVGVFKCKYVINNGPFECRRAGSSISFGWRDSMKGLQLRDPAPLQQKDEGWRPLLRPTPLYHAYSSCRRVGLVPCSCFPRVSARASSETSLVLLQEESCCPPLVHGFHAAPTLPTPPMGEHAPGAWTAALISSESTPEPSRTDPSPIAPARLLVRDPMLWRHPGTSSRRDSFAPPIRALVQHTSMLFRHAPDTPPISGRTAWPPAGCVLS